MNSSSCSSAGGSWSPAVSAIMLTTTAATMTGSVFFSFSRRPYLRAGKCLFSMPLALSMQFLAVMWASLYFLSASAAGSMTGVNKYWLMTGIPSVSHEIAIAWTSFQQGSDSTVVKNSSIMNRTRPTSNHVRDASATVTDQMDVNRIIAFSVPINFSVLTAGWLNCNVCTVYGTYHSRQTWHLIHLTHFISPGLRWHWELHILRAQLRNSFGHFVYNSAYCRLVNIEQVSNHQLECSCSIKSKSNKQLVLLNASFDSIIRKTTVAKTNLQITTTAKYTIRLVPDN